MSHKVIEKRRRDRINRCLNELGKTVPMALAKQVGGGWRGLPGPPRRGGSQGSALSLTARPGPARPGLGEAGLPRLPTDRVCVCVSSPAGVQSSGKLEKAEILEMTVQYLRALHSADFPRGREKGR